MHPSNYFSFWKHVQATSAQMLFTAIAVASKFRKVFQRGLISISQPLQSSTELHGPPKKTLQTPNKKLYGPPKITLQTPPKKKLYGPPKKLYGPPKKLYAHYGPQKQSQWSHCISSASRPHLSFESFKAQSAFKML